MARWRRGSHMLRVRTLSTIARVACGACLAGAVIAGTVIPARAAAPLKWVTVPSVNIGSADNHLNGVSCGSAASCVAVGSHIDTTAGGTQTLIQQWTGTSRALVSSPNGGPDD